MSISVYIPCTPRHFHYIDRIVRAYREGTMQPDEIVVGLCDAENVRWEEWKGNARLYPHMNPLQAGPNRQRALTCCSGDIVAYQDADDLPLPNRIEAIDYAFKRWDIVVLNHGYFFSNDPVGTVAYRDEHFIPPEAVYKHYMPNGTMAEAQRFHAYGEGLGTIHAGAAVVLREVLAGIKWKAKEDLLWAPEPRSKSEDWEFCFELLRRYGKSGILTTPLYIYTVG